MKKSLLALCLFCGMAGVAHADDPTIFWSFGKLNVLVPFSDVSAVYLWDFVGQRSLLGAETPVLSAWKIQVTAGGVSSLDGRGSPIVGAHLALPNPVQNYASLSGLKPGVFGGRDFNTKAWIGGIKVSQSIF